MPEAQRRPAMPEPDCHWIDDPETDRNTRIDRHLAGLIRKLGITGGDVLEIGGRGHPRPHLFPENRFRYRNLDLKKTGSRTVVGDITDCPQIKSKRFDVVFSVDVFEHIDKPWTAAAEIARILRPGGLSYHSTLFSWRYHPCPIDYWRYTHQGLASLFDGLKTLTAGYDISERRKDVRGKGRLDRVPVDALGGWREHWRVFHAAYKKPLRPGAKGAKARAHKQD